MKHKVNKSTVFTTGTLHMQKAIGTYACKIKLNNIDKNMYIYNMIMVFKIR